MLEGFGRCNDMCMTQVRGCVSVMKADLGVKKRSLRKQTRADLGQQIADSPTAAIQLGMIYQIRTTADR